jgi:uncharacterized protein (TIGR00299 family) protein
MTDFNKRILVIDPQMAGISGDMFIGALLDLGANSSRVSEAMTTPKHYLKGCKDIVIVITDVVKNGIRSKMVDVQVEEDVGETTAGELLDVAAACLEDLEISGKAKEYVLASISKLVTAEETIHDQSSKEIHLHELASADTFADIIGAATALDDLNVFENTSVWSTPVSLGGGTIELAHGTMSCPAPATLEILCKSDFLTIGGPIEAELTTPTGAALLTTLATGCTKFYPSMKPVSIGYGAGSKEFSEIPNVLRVILGEPCDFGLLSDEVSVIETNLDDATGELIWMTPPESLSGTQLINCCSKVPETWYLSPQ